VEFGIAAIEWLRPRGLGTFPQPQAVATPCFIVEWQQREDAWFALVDYVIEADRVLVQQWLPAGMLTRTG
jgi:hypothetical protein